MCPQTMTKVAQRALTSNSLTKNFQYSSLVKIASQRETSQKFIALSVIKIAQINCIITNEIYQVSIKPVDTPLNIIRT